jgi:hypothetical protein
LSVICPRCCVRKTTLIPKVLWAMRLSDELYSEFQSVKEPLHPQSRGTTY